MEHWWYNTDTGKPQYLEKNLFQFHALYHRSHMHWAGLELKLGLCGEGLVTNRMSCGMAQCPKHFFDKSTNSFSEKPMALELCNSTYSENLCSKKTRRTINNVIFSCKTLSPNRKSGECQQVSQHTYIPWIHKFVTRQQDVE
jgi:hypothetical protein